MAGILPQWGLLRRKAFRGLAMPDDSVPSCMIMPVRVASPHFVTLVRQSPPRQGQGDAHFHVRRLGRSSKSRRLRAVLHEHAGSCRIVGLLARCCSTRRDFTADFTNPETVIRGLVLAASDVARAWDFCFEERPQTAQNLFQETPKSTTFLRGPQRPLWKLLQLAKMAL